MEEPLDVLHERAQDALRVIKESQEMLGRYHELLLELSQSSKIILYPISILPYPRDKIKDAVKLHLRAAIGTGNLTTKRKDELATYFSSLAHFVDDKKVRFMERYTELVKTGGFHEGEDDEEFAIATAYGQDILRAVEREEEDLIKEFHEHYLEWKELHLQD